MLNSNSILVEEAEEVTQTDHTAGMREEMFKLYEKIEHLEQINKLLIQENAYLNGQITIH